jgi:hypothetical protein
MGRAGRFTRSCAALADCESAGDSLGVLFVNRFSLRQAFIVFIGQRYRADFLAFTAAGTLCQVHQTGLLPYRSSEVSGIAFEIQEFGGRQ